MAVEQHMLRTHTADHGAKPAGPDSRPIIAPAASLSDSATASASTTANASTSDAVPPPAVPFPEHPYAAARDAAYAPPKDRNVGAAPKAQPRAYAPIHDAHNTNDLYQAVLNTPVTLPARTILANPEVSALARANLTPRRITEKKAAEQLYQAEHPLAGFNDWASDPADERETARAAAIAYALPNTATPASAESRGKLVSRDEYVLLYDVGQLPEDLVVSAKTTAIRCVLPVVDNHEAIESIVDPGSQIIAMSEEVCHRLGLQYDPNIVLQMQSANGAVTPSLGVARNVPFRFKDIVLYLQVHIVRNPAYDILLGRPFDTLTRSVIHNYANDNQTITIHCPNTDRAATIPTLPRGSARAAKLDFIQDKMIRWKR
ncbi:hypothetical protein MIND_01152400 [Mycena indigotica]|uniref:Uncharacterized protein n=1 Tax=Mycena indigotica TaxID=2126181 RepID=A0A8H6S7B2_9AGAR|nr:uncharacterized protein MIND_01152400 [Mycena indigotica]KAF7293722.1 hypothetical protein MIND_01152400 [Mycena indigotica]